MSDHELHEAPPFTPETMTSFNLVPADKREPMRVGVQVLSVGDNEIDAMHLCLTALTELPEATQGRVMRWVQDRLAQENHARPSADPFH